MLTFEDKLAIQEVIAKFAHFSDFADWNALESVFTDDVVTEMEGIPMKYSGIAAQVEHARESDKQTSGKNRHYYFNTFIEPVEGGARATYMFLNVNAGGAPMAAQMVTSGRMFDTLRKTGDGWKIAHRFVTFDQSFELDF